VAFASGRDATFKLDDGGGTLRDISTYITNVSSSTDQETYDTTTLHATYRAKILGFSGGKFTVQGLYDATIDGYLAGADTATPSFEYYPAGDPVGATKPKYSGECIKNNYTINDPVDGVQTWTLELETSGAVARAVS